MNDVFSVFSYNEAAPSTAGSTIEGRSISGLTIDLIRALLGIGRHRGARVLRLDEGGKGEKEGGDQDFHAGRRRRRHSKATKPMPPSNTLAPTKSSITTT